MPNQPHPCLRQNYCRNHGHLSVSVHEPSGVEILERVLKTRSIHDNFMFVRGFTRRLHRTNTPSLLFKLDIMKAFDSIPWDYLLDILQRRGFPPRFRDWVAALWASSSSRVLLNRVPGDPIKLGKGLRQEIRSPLYSLSLPSTPCNNCSPKQLIKVFCTTCEVVPPPYARPSMLTTRPSLSPPLRRILSSLQISCQVSARSRVWWLILSRAVLPQFAVTTLTLMLFFTVFQSGFSYALYRPSVIHP